MRVQILSNRYSKLGLLALLVLVLGMLPPALEAAPLEYQTIIGNTVWDVGTSFDTDVVIPNGASLTIANGITVYASNFEHGVAYPGGLNAYKVEIIVESGGTLTVEWGADLMANAAGDWYGVVFLPGSSGSISGASIRNGTVGVTIIDASPTIQGCTISTMQGVSPDLPFGSSGGWAAGMVISGTSAAPTIISNTVTTVNGGTGAGGFAGENGQTPGAPGGDGFHGGTGGNAYGIWVQAGAAPNVQGNTITAINGGSGSVGGSGGNGAAGDATSTTGGSGGNGSYGGDGGKAYGISVEDTTASCLVKNNEIHLVAGGISGAGGGGGYGAMGHSPTVAPVAGGVGGNGGDAGSGGDGGYGVGIYLNRSSALVQDNAIYTAVTGGQSAAGGYGGNAGTGGNGLTPSSGNGENGGRGGDGGEGGDGGYGGDGGVAFGLIISGTSSALVRHNTVSAVISGGSSSNGGDGGSGGAGGSGANGEDDAIDPAGNGGDGGNGGVGGDGWSGGSGGVAIGLAVSSGATPTLSRNSIDHMIGGLVAGSGGQGGAGGAGGDAGDGGVGPFGGNGGYGGFGGGPGAGGGGAIGGQALGIVLVSQHRVENNLVHNLIGGSGGTGGNGGVGGDGGCGGTAGSGGMDGLDRDGVDGGSGGSGGGAGWSTGLLVYENAEIVNNTISSPQVKNTEAYGGSGGLGGTGCSGNNGSTGAIGSTGLTGSGYGIRISNGQPTIFNNILVIPSVGQREVHGGAAVLYGMYADGASPFTNLDYNDVYDWDVAYYNVTAGAHDIQQDPLFVDVTTGNYHLLEGSPCRDSATGSFGGLTAPSDDVDGDSRPQGSNHDIGFDEYVGGASCVPVTSVIIAGPSSGLTGVPYSFGAEYSPLNATAPINVTWTPVPDNGQGSNPASYTWGSAGTYNLQVSLSNCSGAGTANDSHSVTISAGTLFRIFLPLVINHN